MYFITFHLWQQLTFFQKVLVIAKHSHGLLLCALCSAHCDKSTALDPLLGSPRLARRLHACMWMCCLVNLSCQSGCDFLSGSKWHRESDKRKHCLGALPKDINLSGQIVEMWSPLGGKVSFLRLKFTFRVQEYFNFQTILFLFALSRVSNATKYCNISNKIKHLVEKRPNPSVIRMNLSSDELTGLKK